MTRTGYRGSGFPGVAVERRPGAAGRIPTAGRPEPPRLRALAAGWELGWESARRLPEPAAYRLADTAARLAARRDRPGSMVRRNLSRVVGQAGVEELLPDAYRSYGRYWVEAFRTADLDPGDLHRRTTTEGTDHLDRALDAGRGVVCLLAHHGSWDAGARWMETHGYHAAVVAEVLRPRRVFEKFVRLRESVGMDVVPLSRGRDLVGTLAGVLERNHVVGLLGDRDLTGRGPVVPFFGEDARLPAGPVVLARRTGAAIVPVTMLQRPGRRWHGHVLPPVDVAGVDLVEGMRRVAGALESLVRLAPAQWHAFQPIWEADRADREGPR
ncbi:MAG: phosphatidylinositol mannoside acyltransferase [Actinomycetota bacterium]|nr:phosphatidylinositol mannoside acyltransferase [Actinomycetota bacterium]